MESTLVEVLILKELRDNGFYKVVTRMGLEVLEEFEGPRGGDAWLEGDRREACPNQHKQYTIFILIVKYKIVSRLFSGSWGRQGKSGHPRKDDLTKSGTK
jgi:hypothetical protein